MQTLPDGTIVYFPLDGPTSEVAVAWYMELKDGSVGNIMSMVFRDAQDKPWKMVTRTRFYVDNLTDHNSKDRRTGFMVEAEPGSDPDTSRDELVKKVDHMLGEMLSAGLGRLYRQAGHKDLHEFFEVWGKQPWNHQRSMTTEEVERLMETR